MARNKKGQTIQIQRGKFHQFEHKAMLSMLYPKEQLGKWIVLQYKGEQ